MALVFIVDHIPPPQQALTRCTSTKPTGSTPFNAFCNVDNIPPLPNTWTVRYGGIVHGLPKITLLSAILFSGSILSASNLHVACVLPTTCAGNGTDITLSDNPAQFEYGVNGDLGGSATGDFYLLALVPNNEVTGFLEMISATNTANSPVSPVDEGAFTSGKLNDLLDGVTDGFSGLGNGHPLSAYLNATQMAGFDPTATGYEVFAYDFGLVNLPSAIPTFTTGTSPNGTVFTAILTTQGTKSVILDSPNSEGLLVGPATVPEPRFYSLLLLALVAVGGLAWRRAQA